MTIPTDLAGAAGLRRHWEIAKRMREAALLGRKARRMQARAAHLQDEMQRLSLRLRERDPTPREVRRAADLFTELERLQVEFAGMVARHDLLAAELSSLGVPSSDFATFERT